MARPATPVIATNWLTQQSMEFPSMAACADHLGLDHVQIQNCVRGFQRLHKGYSFKAIGPIADTPERPKVRQAANLHELGYSRKVIAIEMGISVGTVGKYIKQAKVKGWIK